MKIKSWFITIIVVIVVGVLATTLFFNLNGPGVAEPSLAAEPQFGHLIVETGPATAQVRVDGQPWSAGQPVQAGPHTVTISAPGYEPVEQSLDVAPKQTVTLRGALIDQTPPRALFQAIPTISKIGTPVDVWLDIGDEGSGLSSFNFYLNGEAMLAQPVMAQTASLTYNLQLQGLEVGLHRLDLAVQDQVSNTVTSTLYIEVDEENSLPPAPEIGVLPPPGETWSAEESQAQQETGQATAETAPVGQPQVTAVSNEPARIETLTIPTYAYEQALSGGPRPTLDANKMGPAAPKSYEAVILENDSLKLTFLPALGGRLYQVTDKATGQNLLYNNPVIKPTRWGPPEMNWWLAAGGMEWAFPVYEHGYAWGMPWTHTTATLSDSVSITLEYVDTPSNLAAQVTVMLPMTGRAFAVSPRLANQGTSPANVQLWVNAALPAGEGMRIEMPASTVKVHSAGQPEGVQAGQLLNWTPEMGTWGHWRTWFSAFAMPVNSSQLRAWGAGSGPGLERSFTPATAPGVKLFTWGTEAPLSEFEGAPYVELWGGLTMDFDTSTSLEPGQSRTWTEMWTVIGRQ